MKFNKKLLLYETVPQISTWRIITNKYRYFSVLEYGALDSRFYINKLYSILFYYPNLFVMEFDHRIDWDNVKILKSEPHAYRRRVAESFLINQKACSCNVINRNDGANFPTVIVCSSPISNVLCFSQHFSLGHSCICDVTMFLLLRDCLPC